MRYHARGSFSIRLWLFISAYSSILRIPILRYCKLNENVFVGGSYGTLGRAVLINEGIRNSICLQDEFDDEQCGLTLGGNYLYLPTRDEASISYDYLIKGLAFIENCRLNDEKVYIHCKSGVGRAPTLVIAHLISKGMTFEAAYDFLKSKRPFVLISDEQHNQLLNISLTESNKCEYRG